MDHSNTTVPEHFICPLTLQVMEQPVKNTKTGHVFESIAILQWIYSGNPTCPLTRQALRPTDLVLNEPLKQEIIAWKESLQTICQIVSFRFDSKDDQEAHVEQLMCTRNRVLTRRAEKIKARLVANNKGQHPISNVACCV